MAMSIEQIGELQKILAEVILRDRETCQRCGKNMDNVLKYLVLHLVRRVPDAATADQFELRCTHCLEKGSDSLGELVVGP